MSVERLLGRSLAMCAHPVLAWRVLSPSRRALLVSAYFGAAYAAVLTALLSLSA